MPKALIVNSSTTAYKDGTPTGSWCSEAMEPYLIFEKAGLTVDMASVAGGVIPWGECSKCSKSTRREQDPFLFGTPACHVLGSMHKPIEHHVLPQLRLVGSLAVPVCKPAGFGSALSVSHASVL